MDLLSPRLGFSLGIWICTWALILCLEFLVWLTHVLLSQGKNNIGNQKPFVLFSRLGFAHLQLWNECGFSLWHSQKHSSLWGVITEHLDCQAKIIWNELLGAMKRVLWFFFFQKNYEIFIQYLKVTFHLQLLQNIDNIPYNVKYILEPVLYPVDCSSHTSTPIIAPSHLSPLVTTTV